MDPDAFSSGLMALEHRWSKCNTLEGNYIEKKKRWISTGNKLGWLLIDSPSYIYLRNKTVSQNIDKSFKMIVKNNSNTLYLQQWFSS